MKKIQKNFLLTLTTMIFSGTAMACYISPKQVIIPGAPNSEAIALPLYMNGDGLFRRIERAGDLSRPHEFAYARVTERVIDLGDLGRYARVETGDSIIPHVPPHALHPAVNYRQSPVQAKSLSLVDLSTGEAVSITLMRDMGNLSRVLRLEDPENVDQQLKLGSKYSQKSCTIDEILPLVQIPMPHPVEPVQPIPFPRPVDILPAVE